MSASNLWTFLSIQLNFSWAPSHAVAAMQDCAPYLYYKYICITKGRVDFLHRLHQCLHKRCDPVFLWLSTRWKFNRLGDLVHLWDILFQKPTLTSLTCRVYSNKLLLLFWRSASFDGLLFHNMLFILEHFKPHNSFMSTWPSTAKQLEFSSTDSTPTFPRGWVEREYLIFHSKASFPLFLLLTNSVLFFFLEHFSGVVSGSRERNEVLRRSDVHGDHFMHFSESLYILSVPRTWNTFREDLN